MDKRSLLFIVLTFFVIMIYSYINAPKMMETEKNDAETTLADKPARETPAPITTSHKFADSFQNMFAIKQNPSNNKLYIDSDIQSYIFDIDKASIISCQLMSYYSTSDRTSRIEMVSEESGQEKSFPLDIIFFDEILQKEYADTPFTVEQDMRESGIIKLDKKMDIVFSKKTDNLFVKKTITFYPDKYGIDVDLIIDIAEAGDGEPISYAVITGPDLLDGREDMKTKGRYTQPDNIIYKFSDKTKGVKYEKIENDLIILPSDTGFISLNDLYFTQVLLSGGKNAYPFYTRDLVIGYVFDAGKSQLSLYLGPKSKDNLTAFDQSLGSLINFGFFSIIASPLHKVINLFYNMIGNYGIAIILLTIAIKLIFFPITFKSYLQMKRMSKLNPQMKELRKKLKDQPQKLNQEIQALYKKHNVNPLSGCLPMFLQLPVLFALYRVLSLAIELRHQHFLWISDLAGPDPYLILPILMSVAMFFQQKLTPTSADPKQAKMMAIMMPALFFIMFRNLQAGLVLYWFTSNLLIIIEQSIITKAHLKEEKKN